MAFGNWHRWKMWQTGFCAGIEDVDAREAWIQRLAKDEADYVRGQVAGVRMHLAAGTLSGGMLELMAPDGQATLKLWADGCVNPSTLAQTRKRERREHKKLGKAGLLKPRRKRLRQRKRG